MDEKSLYLFLGKWIQKLEKETLEETKKTNTKYNQLEQRIFGEISERVKNKVALKYDI